MTDLAPIRWTADTITPEALDALYASLEEARADLDRYEEVQGEMNENAIDLARKAARAEAALSDMTRDRNQQKWYVGENDRKRKVQRARADQAEAERDEARQHAAAIAAQRDRLRSRMNTLADRWDNALAPDKPYARTLRAEISVAPFDPDGAMTVQEYTERGRHLWAFRCWGTETCDGWLGLGHHTQTSALLERERHVAEEHGEPAPAASEATEPCTGRVCAGTGCSHERAATALIAHDQAAGHYPTEEQR